MYKFGYLYMCTAALIIGVQRFERQEPRNKVETSLPALPLIYPHICAIAATMGPEAGEATGPVVDSAPILELEVEKVVGEATPLDGETAPVLVGREPLAVVEEALVTVWRDDELCES
jgi:hypothetical protein